MKLKSPIVLVLVVGPAALAEEELPVEQVNFFEAKIRPVLVEYCYKCHSAEEKIKGG
ncbi:MAG: hypothetical protein GWO24_35270, partial [Akkermansiaceae bacterium]|nr:hypothetical protein [Akkermansiaceae bacterium]